ncbi:HNH endonuclease [Morganella morganii]|uniref:NUMOD4 domain-containing protein n=1 Tax=Morganella morganii TaxID=582 RepID=UPI000D1D6858|nr:NUMOD4 domain-containing protein [Morganella morganii]HCM64764.1 hypothetical protein [Morganella sp. (in: enterobacteria)]QXO42250.1 HNH endonuclease [Morganella morganii]QXO45882.1 HNH endonuclease [Morganella morganii]QXO49553.1 HNH endonuclease [Morganella morganii]QXO53413.1 HNH endonuclease [Morganella morganii]
MNNQTTVDHYGTNLPSEEWVQVTIANFGESYEVSNLGRIRSVDRYTTGSAKKMKIKGKLLKPRVRRDGYLTVNFSFNSHGSQFAVHRLIALTFINNAAGLPYVNHKNGIKTDNRVANLEWVTPKGNIRHAISIGLIQVARGADNTQFKGTIRATDKKTRTTTEFRGKKSLIEFGFDPSSVYACVAGKIKSHRGFTFHRVSTTEVMAC